MPGLKSVKVFQPEPKYEGDGAGAQGAWVGLSCLAESCAGWTDEGDPCLSEASLGRRRSDKQLEGSPQSGPRQSAHPGALRPCPVTRTKERNRSFNQSACHPHERGMALRTCHKAFGERLSHAQRPKRAL